MEGSEIGKTRPCVIVSDDSRNRHLDTLVVCPLTTMVRPLWRTRLQVTIARQPADSKPRHFVDWSNLVSGWLATSPH